MRTKRDFGFIPTAVLLFLLSGNVVGQSTYDEERTPLYLSLKTFEFPGAGWRNNNGWIGDFCCTGETATVFIAEQKPIGYIYFYGFSGGLNHKLNGVTRSSATRINVLVSGISVAGKPDSKRETSSISFDAPEMLPGASHKTIAGALQYTATILASEFTDKTHSSYWMDSVRVRVDVHQLPPASKDQPAAQDPRSK